MPRTANETPQSSFRLDTETLENLDAIAGILTELHERPTNRTDAIRASAKAYAQELRAKKTRRKT